MVGTWSNNDSSLGVTVQVDDKGVFTGTTSGAEVGQCTLSGTVALAQPGSAKNMYELKLKAVNAATASKDDCELTLATAGSYVGPAAIGLVLSLIVLTREIVPRAGEDEEEDESEKAVARVVSGKGIDPPRAGPGEPRGD